MLEGIRVIEYATYMAAPGAGGIMADWGAEVIKVEPPGGDPIRKFFASIGTDLEDNPVFEFDNRGKRGIVLNTATPEGAEALCKLAETADVFLTNVRPGGLKRAGLDFETLSKRNPKLVYCALTGYGLEGPDADRPGFDVASYWSRSGMARLTAPKGSDPFPVRTAQGDHTTSLATAAAINAALIEALKTGKGRLVDVSLLRAALYTMGSDMAIQLYYGRVASTRPRTEAQQPMMNFYRTKDDHWICVVSRQGNVDWPRICRAFGCEELIEDERCATPKARRNNAEETVALLDKGAAQFTKEELMARMDEEQLAWAPVQTLGEAAEDPQVLAAGGVVEVPNRAGDGTFKSPASPARFVGADDGPKGRAPLVGEHTEEVLSSIGYDKETIEKLIADAG